ncbi:HAMP domain-containing histidine kinase [Flavobacterium sp. ANB]|uniref:sensor histidine kinase n=1 Tax=unclassified Flavobacterium TaxID=196869 RepID=UPI0012B7F5E8|nr:MULTISPECIES: HAMP domain-containing sensor histidine kinase [unclassified Flavobacterium]MBF4516120.1 HAMP domain-containing histidine kinase [Flavobacterium sp. ANB]MTD72217.1 sensor histidine kinase [Flavobacterium sp. LC2016-13]
MNKKKLLHKTTRSFLIFAIVTLLVSAPVFYYISQWLYIYETEEVLLMHKGDFERESHKNFTQTDIDAWNKYNRDVRIVPDMRVTKDSIVAKMIYDSTAREKEPYYLIYAPIHINGKTYTYTEKINLLEMEGMVYSVAIMFLFIIIILLVGIIWLSKITSTKLWKPFYNTLNQIHDFEIDKNKSPQFLDTDVDEFDRLNKSLLLLIEKNTAIYKNQREFVENAAHELQTPLALFQTKIDTLLQLQLNQEQSILVGSLSKDVSRLNRLNKNLLLLSKIDNETYLEKNEILINDYIKKHLDFFTEQATSKNLDIITEFSADLKIIGNPALTEVLINNLFLNAIRHNEKNGRIVITTLENELIFFNTGEKTPLIIDKLFNRFSKNNPSSQGNGLGLAIIKKITELNHWEISYSFHNNLHSFSVKF